MVSRGLDTTRQRGHYVTKSTVQSIHSVYQKHLASAMLEPQDVVELLAKQRGHPLYLGQDLDSQVMMHFVKVVV